MKVYKTTDMLSAYRRRISELAKMESFVIYWGEEYIQNVLGRLETLHQNSCETPDATVLQLNLDEAKELCQGMWGELGKLKIPYSFSCRCDECGNPSLVLVGFGEWQREWGLPHFVCKYCIDRISDKMKKTAMDGP